MRKMKTGNVDDRPASAETTAGRQETIDVVTRNWRAKVETARIYRDRAGRRRTKSAGELFCAWSRAKSAIRGTGKEANQLASGPEITIVGVIEAVTHGVGPAFGAPG